MLKALIISAVLIMSTTIMAAESPTLVAADSSTQTLEIKKMTCSGCVSKVKKSLAKVKGVRVIKASTKSRTVKLKISDADTFDIEQAIAAIKKGTGWEATVK